MTSSIPNSEPSLVSLRSLLLMGNEDEEEEDGDALKRMEDEGVDWKSRCWELEASLNKFRSQAAKIREVLRDKLADLERRVVDAERRAETAEQKARLMEDRLLDTSSLEKSTGHAPSPLPSPNNAAPKPDVVNTLSQEVEEQKKLRIQDAKQVEAKAAKIKEWVTNKLKDLELQNAHLREQNQKCNEQLELLRNRLLQISALNGGRKKPNRISTEDSSRGSFEERGESEEEEDSLCRLSNEVNRRDAESLYAAVDYAKKRAQLRSIPPRVKIERKKYQENHLSIVSSIASEDDLSTIDPSLLGSADSLVVNGGGPATRGSSHRGATTGRIRSESRMAEKRAQEGYGSLDRNLVGQRKLHLAEVRGSSDRRKLCGDEGGHDYAEICGTELDFYRKPPTPPLHRFPSWESRIYDVAVQGITVPESLQSVPTGSPNNNSLKGDAYAGNGAFPDLNIPVYATVKGRASQIRSVPFTGESSDSSDNEESTTRGNSSQTTSGETESPLSGSPSKKSAHTPRQSSPTKSVKRDTSAESVLSDDYAIPPDAISSDALSIESVEPNRTSHVDSPKKESFEKSGYLTKLGGKLKTWRRRWFVLKNGNLSYFKSQSDIYRKPQGQITLDDVCRVTRAEGAATFEISTGKRTYYLTAESVNTMEEWIKVLQNVLRRNATRLLLSREDNRPTIEGWITKVKHGHSRRCWCVLIGRMFLYFKTPNETSPLGQINMRDARVEEVSHVSDSDDEETGRGEEGHKGSEHTLGIFPNHQGPTYLLVDSRQEMDAWLYHLTVVSSGDNFVGTQFEQLVTRLMEVDGDENSVLWRHPLLLYSKENITQTLTTLPSEELQVEAIKLFKSIQLFISVPLETSGIDYHIALAQNSLQQCLLHPELQNELFCQLIKQTARHSHHRLGVQQLLLCATQSLFLCDTSASGEKTSPASTSPPGESKLNPAPFVFIQSWQLLALAVTLFVPKNRTLWFLRGHLQRNAENKTEAGKYATFCQRALERALLNGPRECKPSRMEVLSILLKNPYHHSLPHSIPVHYLNGTYQVVGFDGSSTVEEFIQTLNAEAGIRDQSGFALYSDDPIDKQMEHCLHNSAKLCDVISKWEQALREKQLGKFETTKVLKLTYKNRLCFRQLLKAETDRERILTAFQINEDIVEGRFPLSRDLSLELAALMAQIEFGDFNGEKPRGSGGGAPGNPQHQLQQVISRFFPQRYRDPETDLATQERIRDKWISLKGRNVLDCVRIYLNCARKWSFCGSRLYSAKLRGAEPQSIWLAVTEDSVALLDCVTMQPLARYPYSMVVTFGGCREDFMLVVSPPEGDNTEKLLFLMAKPKILELTLLIADYMNALGRPTTVPPSPATSTLSRLEKIRAKIRGTSGSVGCGGSPVSLRSLNSGASTITEHAGAAKALSSSDLLDRAREKKRPGRDST